MNGQEKLNQNLKKVGKTIRQPMMNMKNAVKSKGEYNSTICSKETESHFGGFQSRESGNPGR